MKKILFITNVPAPYTVKFFELLGKNYDLTVVYERKTASNREKEWFSEVGKSYKEIYLKGIKFGEEAAFCIDVIRYLKMKFDMIIIGNYSSPTGILTILSLLYMKKKFYIHVDGGMKAEREGIKKYVKQFLLSHAEGFFSPGEITDEYIRFYAGESKKILHYSFSSVEQKEVVNRPLSNYQKKNIIKSLEPLCDIKDDDFIIVSVGSIIPRKGYDILLKSIIPIKEKVIVFIIGGKESSALANIMQDNQMQKVFFIDFMEHSKIKEYLQSADLFILSTRYDIWGLVVNEALAAGLPIITSDMCVAGRQLVENDYNGYIFRSENYHELTRCIEKVMERPASSRNEMAQRSIDIANKYTIEKMNIEYADSIEKFLQNEVDSCEKIESERNTKTRI